jgi:hypothetical protein
MNTRGYGVYASGAVRVSGDGYTAVAVDAPVSVYPDFDAAYEAAYEAGGDRWVIALRGGASEYVPEAS